MYANGWTNENLKSVNDCKWTKNVNWTCEKNVNKLVSVCKWQKKQM